MDREFICFSVSSPNIISVSFSFVGSFSVMFTLMNFKRRDFPFVFYSKDQEQLKIQYMLTRTSQKASGVNVIIVLLRLSRICNECYCNFFNFQSFIVSLRFF